MRDRVLLSAGMKSKPAGSAAAPTPTQRLAGVLLGQPVEQWIATRRAAGRSWRLIARDLYEATNGQVDVTHEALRRWAEDRAA